MTSERENYYGALKCYESSSSSADDENSSNESVKQNTKD